MRHRKIILALLPALGLAAAPARADLRMVQVVTTSGHVRAVPRKMTLTPPPQGAKPGGADNTVRVTLSVRGDACRADDGAFSTIIDRAAKRETFLDRTRRTYLQDAWDADTQEVTKIARLDVHRTGSAARMLGHPAHEYVLDGTLGGYPLSGTVWAADDLAQPVIPTTLGGQSSNAWAASIPGLVLKENLYLGVPGTSATGQPEVPVTWHLQTRVVSLSTAPLPASAFVIPPGYTPRKAARK